MRVRGLVAGPGCRPRAAALGLGGQPSARPAVSRLTWVAAGGREITQHPALQRFVSLSSLSALYAAEERWLVLNFLPSRLSILRAGENGH